MRPIMASWLTAMGFNTKEMHKAVPMLGVSINSARQKNSVGYNSEWSKAERLAMMALWLGLPEWSPAINEIPPDRRDVIMAAAKVIRSAISEPGPDPGEAPAQ